MNASVVYLLCVLSADPIGGHTKPTYTPSKAIKAAIRGQSPAPYYPDTTNLGATGDISAYPAGPVIAPSQGVVAQYQPGQAVPYDSGPYGTDPFGGQFGGPPGQFGGPPGQYFGPSYGFGAFYMGYDNVILKPHFTSDSAFESVRTGVLPPNRFLGSDETLDTDNTDSTTSTPPHDASDYVDPASFRYVPDQRVHSFDWDLEYSPRFWIGFAGQQGLGFQIRYWQFDHHTSLSARDTNDDDPENDAAPWDDDGDTTYYAGFGHGLFGAGNIEGINEDNARFPIADPETTLLFRPAQIVTWEEETIFARHDLKLHALDVEGTWHSFNSPRGSVTVTGGIRIVSMDQGYRAVVNTEDSTYPENQENDNDLFFPGNTQHEEITEELENIQDEGNDGDGPAITALDGNDNDLLPFDQALTSEHDFDGAGPTISLFGRRRLGNSNFALFSNARFSAVYGNSGLKMEHTVVQAFDLDDGNGTFDPTHADNFDGGGDPGDPEESHRLEPQPDGDLDDPFDIVNIDRQRWTKSNDRVIPITELQLGIEWSTPLYMFGGSRFFLRAAMEGQMWWDTGTGMNTTSGGDTAEGFGHNTSPQVSNLGLFGFTVGGGLSF